VNDVKGLDQSLEFQRRRTRWLHYFTLSAVAAIAGIALAIWLEGKSYRWIHAILLWPGFSGMFLAARIANYKCPRCNTIPSGEEMIAFDPVECPRCRAKLK
jgi:hypothetical protein